MSKYDVMRTAVRVVQSAWDTAAPLMHSEIKSGAITSVTVALNDLVDAIYAAERASMERELDSEMAAIQAIEKELDSAPARPSIGGMVLNATLSGDRFTITNPASAFWSEDDP